MTGRGSLRESSTPALTFATAGGIALAARGLRANSATGEALQRPRPKGASAAAAYKKRPSSALGGPCASWAVFTDYRLPEKGDSRWGRSLNLCGGVLFRHSSGVCGGPASADRSTAEPPRPVSAAFPLTAAKEANPQGRRAVPEDARGGAATPQASPTDTGAILKDPHPQFRH
jgi:hypothetical protein